MSFLPEREPPPKYPGFEGSPDAKIAIVGEAWGANEARTGKPFCGPAGQELDKLLHSADIQRLECYITNVVKAHPPGNDITKYIDPKKRFISPEAKEMISLLKEELESCKANVIIAVGGTALYVLTECTGILKWRGSILESTLVPGRKIVPTIHPRAVLGPSGVYLWKHWIQFDLRRAKEESLYPDLRLPSMRLLTRPSLIDVLEYTKLCKDADIVDVDIEILREEISCVALSFLQWEAISIPFVDDRGNYWSPDEEVQVWRAIASILEDPKIQKRGQNFLFDMSFFLQRHGIRTVNVLDTMVAQAIAYPDFPKGLDFITSSYTRIPYYKDEGKKWSRISGNWTQHWEYNAKDVLATSNAFPVLIQHLESQNNLPTFKRQNSLLEPLSAMQLRGVRMDHTGLKMAHESVSKQLDSLTNEFYKACGKEINLGSPKQIKEYFYGTKGLTPYKNRKTGADSVDADALKRLSRKGHREATLLLEIRRLAKLKGTYLEIELDPDGRLRCSYNPVGTETGRLSSSKNIFGRGTNLQNQPPEMKRLMLFDEGYVGYNIDLSQAENRIVAYVGPVPEMIRCFEEGRDVHALTGSLISNLTPDEVKEQDERGIFCEIGGGVYTWRFWGKKANHGLNYDLGYKAFGLIYEIPENEARYIVDRYHLVYPGVRQGFHTQVRSMLSRSRTVTNLLGRNRLFLDRWGDSLFKEAYAQIPQSSVADIIDERGLNYLYYNQEEFHPVELLLQVHDSIVFQVPKSTPWKQHADILIKLKQSLETPLEWRGRRFVIPIDLQMSVGNMGKYKKRSNEEGLRDIPRSAMQDPDTLTSQLEETYLAITNGFWR